MKIPFSPPYIDEAVINEVVDSLRSGWITSGPKVKPLCKLMDFGSHYDASLVGSNS